MGSAWVAGPPAPRRAGPDLARELAAAHEAFLLGDHGADRTTGVRPLIADSWRRSRDSAVDPEQTLAAVDLTDLEDYRASHPLNRAMPVVRRLLGEAAGDADLVVAVTDVHGRLLWVEGSRHARAQAAGMHFVEGAVWDEARVGTNAPGTALVLDHAVQVFSTEHFSRIVHGWSCSAAPVHDPLTGSVLGAIDLTGGDHVATPQTLALVRATAAAVEAELRLAVLSGSLPGPRGAAADDGRRPARSAARTATEGHLSVLGRDQAVLRRAGRAVELSRRHSELLLLLATAPEGRSAEELAVALNEHEPALVTVRAELSRLRRVLGDLGAGAGMDSRPYRLRAAIATDADEVVDLLDAGLVRAALERYAGPVLPRSQAPAVAELRAALAGRLRTAALSDGRTEVLDDLARRPETADDLELWEAVLAGAPPGTPRRSRAAARVRHLTDELGLDRLAATSLQRPRT